MRTLIIILLLLPALANADEPFWEYLYGPEGGYSYSIKENDKNEIFVCTKNGVYRSASEACSWDWILKGGRIYNCAISKSGIIFITRTVDSLGGPINKKEFLYSEDDGNTWKKVNDNIPYPREFYFNDKDELYALYTDSDSIEIYFTEDYGKTWNRNGHNFNSNGRIDIYKLHILSSDTIAISGYYDDGKDSWGIVFFSTDKGNTWKEFTAILKSGVYDLLKNKKEEYIVRTKHGIIISSDNGNSWNFTLGEEDLKLVIQANDGKIFAAGYNGLFVSDDFGHSWIKISEMYIDNLYIDDDYHFYASSADGLYKSNDMGATWIKCYKNISAHQVYDLGTDKLGNIYAVISSGIFIKKAGGKDFTFYRPYNYYPYWNLEVSKRNNLYVTYGRNKYDKTNGVCYTTDQGRSWDTLPMDFPGLSIRRIDVDENENIYLSSDTYNILRTTDMGQTWERIARSLHTHHYCVAFNSEGHWFTGAGTFDLYRSTDEGETWERQINQLEGFGLTEIVFHPTNGVGYAGGGYGLYRTSDNGRTWSKKATSGELLALDSAGDFYCYFTRISEDGNKFHPLGISGFLPFHYPEDIEIGINGHIYCAAEYGGLYRSREPVVSVEEAPEQPAPASGTALEVRPNPCTESAAIHYALTTPGTVRLSLYNLLGMEAASWDEGLQPPGAHTLTIDTSPLPPGAYLLRLEAGSHRQSVMVVRE